MSVPCFSTLPEDGSPVPKLTGVDTMNCILWYVLCCVLFYWVHFLVNVLNIRQCTVCVTRAELNTFKWCIFSVIRRKNVFSVNNKVPYLSLTGTLM
jgi:hypothetical protein